MLKWLITNTEAVVGDHLHWNVKMQSVPNEKPKRQGVLKEARKTQNFELIRNALYFCNDQQHN